MVVKSRGTLRKNKTKHHHLRLEVLVCGVYLVVGTKLITPKKVYLRAGENRIFSVERTMCLWIWYTTDHSVVAKPSSYTRTNIRPSARDAFREFVWHRAAADPFLSSLADAQHPEHQLTSTHPCPTAVPSGFIPPITPHPLLR